jgi:pimeloyl-ACP methyl ester carboxylesterase
MYIHGEADRAIPTDFAVGCFKSTWPDGPVVTLPGVGHFLQEDAPEAVIALIQQFLQMTD